MGIFKMCNYKVMTVKQSYWFLNHTNGTYGHHILHQTRLVDILQDRIQSPYHNQHLLYSLYNFRYSSVRTCTVDKLLGNMNYTV